MLVGAVPARAGAPATGAARTVPGKAEAEGAYKKVVETYMRGDVSAVPDALKAVERFLSLLTPDQREDLLYVRKVLAEHRPAWWNSCKSGTKTAFQARIWDVPIGVNLNPSTQPSVSLDPDPRKKTISANISWQPEEIESSNSLGDVTKAYGVVSGDLAEVRVWYFLGLCYLPNAVPFDQFRTLYADYRLLAEHIQEFYAAMTSMYYTTPRARLAYLLLMPGNLGMKSDREAQARAATAVGAILLAEVLADPAEWPSLQLPPKPPETNVERETILYMLTHVQPSWSLDEDVALRVLVRDFMTEREQVGGATTTRGAQVLRGKGEVTLPGKLTLKLLATDDREFQKKRNAWVAERLTRIAEAKTRPAAPPK